MNFRSKNRPNSLLFRLLLITIIISLHQIECLPRILKGPENRAIVPGSSGTIQLTCQLEATDSSSKAFNADWIHNGTTLPKNSNQHMTTKSPDALNLILLDTTPRWYGSYQCNVSDSEGFVVSSAAIVSKAFLGSQFIKNPKKNIKVGIGENVELQCGAPEGNPKPTIVWFKDKVPLAREHSGQYDESIYYEGGSFSYGDDSFSTDEGPTTNAKYTQDGNLVIARAERKDSGTYFCRAINDVGEIDSKTSTLRVLPKPSWATNPFTGLQTIPPAEIVVAPGETLRLVCNISDESNVYLTFNRRTKTGSVGLVDVMDRTEILNKYTLLVKNITPADEGLYSCSALNDVGSLEHEFTVSVNAPVNFLERPRDVFGEKGMNAVMRCSVNGHPSPHIYWSLPTRHLTGLSEKTLAAGQNTDNGRIFVAEDNSLHVQKMSPKDVGTYHCIAAPEKGPKLSASAKIAITNGGFQSTEQKLLVTPGQNFTVNYLANFTIFCGINTIDRDSYSTFIRWFDSFNQPLELGTNKKLSPDFKKLSFTNAKQSDSGSYSCVLFAKNDDKRLAISTSNVIIDFPTYFVDNLPRSYDPSRVPGQPTRPAMVNKSDTSVFLTWTAPNHEGAASVTKYAVEKKRIIENDGDGGRTENWQIHKGNITTPFHLLTNLVPSTTYQFRVRAFNYFGISLPSPALLTPVRTMDPSEGYNTALTLLNCLTVHLLQSEVIDANSVRVNWHLEISDSAALMRLQPERLKKKISRLAIKILFAPTDPIGSKSSETFDSDDLVVYVDISNFVFEFKAGASKERVGAVLINGLRAFTRYEISSIPIVSLASTPGSPRQNHEAEYFPKQIISTPESLPVAPPTILKLDETSNRSMTITVRSPPKHTINGRFTSLNLKIFDLESRIGSNGEPLSLILNQHYTTKNMMKLGDIFIIKNVALPVLSHAKNLANSQLLLKISIENSIGSGPFAIERFYGSAIDPSARISIPTHSPGSLLNFGDQKTIVLVAAISGGVLLLLLILCILLAVIVRRRRKRRKRCAKERFSPSSFGIGSGETQSTTNSKFKGSITPHHQGIFSSKSARKKYDSEIGVQDSGFEPILVVRGDGKQGQMVTTTIQSVNSNSLLLNDENNQPHLTRLLNHPIMRGAYEEDSGMEVIENKFYPPPPPPPLKDDQNAIYSQLETLQRLQNELDQSLLQRSQISIGHGQTPPIMPRQNSLNNGSRPQMGTTSLLYRNEFQRKNSGGGSYLARKHSEERVAKDAVSSPLLRKPRSSTNSRKNSATKYEITDVTPPKHCDIGDDDDIDCKV